MTRSIPLSLTTLVAVFTAIVALSLSGGHASTAGAATQHDHAMTTALTAREVDLRMGMRHLWEDHVSWTRMAVISLTGDLPDTKVTVARLLRNQADIGAAIKPYYGRAAGQKLTSLLRQHILIAADLIASSGRASPKSVATSASTISIATSSWSSPGPTQTPTFPASARTSPVARHAARSTRACALSSAAGTLGSSGYFSTSCPRIRA